MYTYIHTYIHTDRQIDRQTNVRITQFYCYSYASNKSSFLHIHILTHEKHIHLVLHAHIHFSWLELLRRLPPPLTRTLLALAAVVRFMNLVVRRCCTIALGSFVPGVRIWERRRWGRDWFGN